MWHSLFLYRCEPRQCSGSGSVISYADTDPSINRQKTPKNIDYSFFDLKNEDWFKYTDTKYVGTKQRKLILAVLGIRIQDPVPFCPLYPGSGMGKKSRSISGIRIRDEYPGSYFRELRNNFFGLIPYFFLRCVCGSGTGIRESFGPWIREISNIVL